MVVFTVFAFSVTSFSQTNFVEGYIISDKGDTINGYVHQKFWIVHPDTISFRKTPEGKINRYSAYEIKGFKVGDELFRSAKVEVERSKRPTEGRTTDSEFIISEKQAFIKALYLGKKSLFYLRSGMEIKNFFIEIEGEYILLLYKQYVKYENGRQRIIEKKNFVGQLAYYLDDCEKIRGVLNDTDYELDQLKKVFRIYYNCAPYDYSYASIKKKVKVNSRLIGGAVFTTLNFKGTSLYHEHLINADFSRSMQPALGYSLNIVAPNTDEKWIIRNELMFSYFVSSGSYEEQNEPNRRLWFESDLEVLFVKMTHMLQYSPALGRDFRFLAAVGPTYGFNVLSVNNVTRKEMVFDSFYANDYVALPERAWVGGGVIATAGISYRKWTLEFRGEIYTGLSSQEGMPSPMQSLYILTSFKL